MEERTNRKKLHDDCKPFVAKHRYGSRIATTFQSGTGVYRKDKDKEDDSHWDNKQLSGKPSLHFRHRKGKRPREIDGYS